MLLELVKGHFSLDLSFEKLIPVFYILTNFPSYHSPVRNVKFPAVLTDKFNQHPPSHCFSIIEYF
jgi:hypothetical protein